MSEWIRLDTNSSMEPKENQLVLLLCERKLKEYGTEKEIIQRDVCLGKLIKLSAYRKLEYCERTLNSFDEYYSGIYNKIIAWQPLPSTEVKE